MSNLNRPEAMRRAMEFALKSGIEGDYLEFGVFEGYSLTNALRFHAELQAKLSRTVCRRFFAFDSFAGLPELAAEDRLEGYQVFEPGQYACSVEGVKERLREAGVPGADDVVFVRGYYEQSLRDPATLALVEGVVASVVHIDCDLASSARACLDFVGDRVADGAVVLFDDWFCYRGRPDRGVHSAFRAWLSSWGGSASEYFRYSWAGMAWILHRP